MSDMMQGLTAQKMREALQCLDELLSQQVTLIVGGGGAMLLAYDFPLATSDIDAMPKGMEIAELDVYVKQVAQTLGVAPDWLNPYYSTFTHTLPPDYGTRLVTVFNGKNLQCQALGMEDLLIMKCFAHRKKDVGHSKALIKKGAQVKKVEEHIEGLLEKNIPGAQSALDFLDDLLDQ